MTQEGFLQKYAAQDANTVRTLRNTVAAFIRHINNALQKLTLSNQIHREIYDSLTKDKQFLEELRKKAAEALDALPSAQSASKSDAKRSECVRHSQKYEEDHKKDITKDDARTIQTIGEKSIKDFTSEEIQKAKKWAHKFYNELGNKSPFFRAWFGDWRAYDKSRVEVVDVPTIDIKDAVLTKGTYNVSDTGWNVYAGRTLDKDTRHHSGGNRINVKALSAVDSILENAVLLDTRVSNRNTKTKSENTVFLHKLYTIIVYDNKPFLAISTVEEYYDESKNADSLRAYNLKTIKIEPAGGREGITPTTPDVGKDSTSISITELFRIVKQHDERFTEGVPVNETLLNADGTPKVLYHQTGADFSVFSTDHPAAGAHDSETPNGIFLKDNDHDIGLDGKKQMAVYARMEHPLHFKNRQEANAWYRKYIPGYQSLSAEMDKAVGAIDAEMNDLEKEMFKEETTDERYDELDAEWNKLHEKMGEVEDGYRDRLRELLNGFFLHGSKYDGIILDYDGHRYVGEDRHRENVKTYIVFKNTQIKSATDNIGTFDRNNPDIRFSLKPASNISEENRRLIEENEMYKAVIGKLQQQISALQKKVVDPKGVRKLAKDVRAEYRSKIPQADLEQKLTDLFDYIANEQDIDFSEIMRVTAEIAKDVISQSSALNTELTEQYKDMRERLKTSKIRLTSLQKNEMAVRAGFIKKGATEAAP